MTNEEVNRAWRIGLPLNIGDKNSIIHAMCPYLRNFRPCKNCPEWEEDERHGKIKRGCYGVAEEVMNICQTGHPHRHYLAAIEQSDIQGETS